MPNYAVQSAALEEETFHFSNFYSSQPEVTTYPLQQQRLLPKLRRPLWCKRPLLVLLNSSINQENRCGTSELDARENCRNTCAHSGDCGAGQWCWGVHANYCGSIPQRTYTNPVQSTVWTRCGTSEIHARTFCGEPCTWQCSTPGEICVGIHSNYCDSAYTE